MLAGQAAGSTYNGDSAPLNSPPQATIAIVPGQGLRIVGTGLIGLNAQAATIPPNGTSTNDDLFGWYGSYGIGPMSVARGALIGVFVSDRVNAQAAPPGVDFTGGNLDAELLAPLLQQPFLIGTGKTAAGAFRTFVVPQGGTRLFLGVAGSENARNTGSFTATLSVVPIPTFPGNPLAVPGTAQLMLAGQPPGSTYNGDSAPWSSPPQATMAIVPGQGLRIVGTGLIGLNAQAATIPPNGTSTNDDLFGWYGSYGIGPMSVARGALIGVFVSDRVNAQAAPPGVDFTGGNLDAELLAPLLQQPFLIGTGKTGAGTFRTFVVPQGGTRLFVGVAGSVNTRNTGSFTATVSVVPIPTFPGNPLAVPGTAQLMLAGQPAGSTYNGDSVPWNSPAQVAIPIVPGQGLRIVGTGLIGLNAQAATISPNGTSTNDDLFGWYGSYGIGPMSVARAALIGVFVSDRIDANGAPPKLDFTLPSVLNLARLSPLLQQPFLVGTGLTAAGAPKAFVVPSGATRLFLGVAGVPNLRNTGYFIVTVSPESAATPIVSQSGIVNGAGFGPAPLAPGSIASIFGTTLSARTAAAQAVPLPTALADTVVWFELTQAPLFYVSPGQINVQIPFQVNPSKTQVVVSSGGIPSLPMPLGTSPFAPGIFTTGTGAPVILNNSTGRLVSAQEPAKRGDVLIIYATGLGAVTPAVAAGSAAPLDQLSLVTTPVTVVIGAVEATPQFAGLAPGFVGLYQINVAVPGGVSSGSQTLRLSQGGVLSNAVQISVVN
jgi:uncharacterized protein (TIGR03437 family)